MTHHEVWTSDNNGGAGTIYERMGAHFGPLLENETTEPVLSVLWWPWLELGNDTETMTTAHADLAAQGAIREAIAIINDGRTESDEARLHAMIGAIVAYRQALATSDDHWRQTWVRRSCAFLRVAGK